LRHLVTFRQIRIKIIFTGKVIMLLNFAVQRKSQFNGIFNGLYIHLGQSAWVCQCNGTDMCIRVGTESSAIATKQFALGKQLGMYFQPNYYLVFFIFFHGCKGKAQCAVGNE
jgi:hypothetical protein